MNSNINIIREACVNSYLEARRAFRQGADRVELCDNINEGGTTPSYGTIQKTLQLSSSVAVMIRPRGGNFVYSAEEVEIMIADIGICKSLGVKEVVLGVLTKDDRIDSKLLSHLIQQAAPMDVVFHMAVDECKDYDQAVQELISLRIKRFLTKGGKFERANVDSLRRIQDKFGASITILCGGGVNSDNYVELAKLTGCTQLHGTRLFDLKSD